MRKRARRSGVVGAGTDASRTVYFKKETNNGETNNVEMLCCNHKVHHFKTSRILNNSSKTFKALKTFKIF